MVKNFHLPCLIMNADKVPKKGCRHPVLAYADGTDSVYNWCIKSAQGVLLACDRGSTYIFTDTADGEIYITD